MQKNFVLTLSGPDRVGIVEEVTGRVLDLGGNVETSRMARLGGEFAILMLVSMPEKSFEGLDKAFENLTANGYTVTTTQARQSYAESHPGWLRYRIEGHGADHEGIIHQIAHYLSVRGINIESMESETFAAPISGVPLITMTAHVVVSQDTLETDWREGLENIGTLMNLEIHAFRVMDP